MNPYCLRCEYTENPIGIDKKKPRLQWKCKGCRSAEIQTGYRLIVSADAGEGHAMPGDGWDSGAVESTDCFCDYAGPLLQSMKRYFWSVSIKGQDGTWSDFSEPAFFEMGLLESGLWKGKWIGSPLPCRCALLFRHTEDFACEIVRARAYIATEGYSELWINGAKAGSSILDPSNADYNKTVYYITHDITAMLRHGRNAFGVILNSGWSRQAKFNFQMYAELSDGSSVSVSSCFGGWVAAVSPVISATIYSGSVYSPLYEKPEWNRPDDRFERNYVKKPWSLFCTELPLRREDNSAVYDEYHNACFDAMEVPAPPGSLIAQLIDPIEITGEISPVSVKKLDDGSLVYDYGQNFAGFVRFSVSGPQGAVVTVKYSELLEEDGTLNMEYLKISDPSYPLPMQTDVFMLGGGSAEVLEPKFTYHGFRYAGVSCDYKNIKINSAVGRTAGSSVKQSGFFSCSDDLVNKIQNIILWTEKSNLYSIPTDCCQRSERQGWLNDLTARAEGSVYNFGLKLFYEKFERDIADTQDPVSGAIADTAPFRRGNFPADAVASSYLILPYLIYLHYGDERPLSAYYDGMKKWTLYLYRNSLDGIVPYSLYGDWASPEAECLWNSPVSASTPGSFVSSCYCHYNISLMEKYAQLLGKTEDAGYFGKLRADTKKSLNRCFFNKSTANYSSGSQGANVLALYTGIVPQGMERAVAKNVADDVVKRDFHLSTGNLATKYLLEVLSEYGYTDVAYGIVSQTTYPGWGYMLSKGATTVWERWEYATGYGMNSHNHPMYGSISAWFYKYLAGISPAAPGFSKILIKPFIPLQLESAGAELETVRGRIKTRWEKSNGRLRLQAVVPFGAVAVVCVPVAGPDLAVTVNGRAAWQNGKPADFMSIESAEYKECGVCFRVGAGNYIFECAL